ncbi:alpha/beta fold hydrolase [Halomonas elongata]|uniref:alpha/beta fold hydrolase n=1 Tax=Halomonas elongata TaxID=2746 RepID=UPI00255A7CA1|nr:alpha/beta fold hydrolase [Halomonas elongata]MDL4860904.1 alpha/beta fold hydrolase [Halomonas elongata]
MINFCTTSDGVCIAYATAGRGPPPLRVGGWMTHLERDWNSPVWRHWLRELTRDHTLGRFDIRGSGLSDHQVPGQGVEAWVQDLEAVANALGWRRFPLFGICQGGAVAAAYAARYPERVSHLILYNAYSNGAYTAGVSKDKADEARALERLIDVGWGRRSGAFREVFARLMSPREAGEQVTWWEQLQRLTAEPDDAVRLWRGFHELDIRSQLQRIEAPTLVAHVKGDRMVPFEAGRSLAAQIHGARFLPLDGENHILQLSDSGWPVLVAELRQFLAGMSAETSWLPPGFDALTHRERMILDAIARGLTNSEMAREFSIAPKTVRNHVSNIGGKLAASSRSELIVKAREAGFGHS